MPDSAAFAQAFCDRAGVERDDALRLILVIEELFTNSVRHGYGGESDAPICIALQVTDGRISLLYEDWAPRYDPSQRFSAPPASFGAAAEARAIGGLGIYLVGQLVADARYAYEEGANRLWLTMP